MGYSCSEYSFCTLGKLAKRQNSGSRYGVGSSALTHGKTSTVGFSLDSEPAFSSARCSLRLASRRCVHRSFVGIRALQLLRHSYASRSADFAAPHLLIMPQLHVDALKAAVSVLRFFSASCMSLLHLAPSQCRCKPCSALLAAAFFAHLTLSYNFTEACT